MSGVGLDELGRRQIKSVADILADFSPERIQSSPQRRALQSAAIIAAKCGLDVEMAPAFDEIDMGDWTGATFADLEKCRDWHDWNQRRGSSITPGGESMAMLQRRVVGHIERLGEHEGPGVIVSHAEPIRAVVMHYLGIPLDRFHTVEIDPASISTLVVEGSRRSLSDLNRRIAA
jgi:broad specificity phosphatase PhoE